MSLDPFMGYTTEEVARSNCSLQVAENCCETAHLKWHFKGTDAQQCKRCYSKMDNLKRAAQHKKDQQQAALGQEEHDAPPPHGDAFPPSVLTEPAAAVDNSAPTLCDSSSAPLSAPRPLSLGGGSGSCSGAPPTIPAAPVSRHLGGAFASQCRGLAATARHTQPAPLAAPAASHSLSLGLRQPPPLGPTHGTAAKGAATGSSLTAPPPARPRPISQPPAAPLAAATIARNPPPLPPSSGTPHEAAGGHGGVSTSDSSTRLWITVRVFLSFYRLRSRSPSDPPGSQRIPIPDPLASSWIALQSQSTGRLCVSWV